jgi:hypothetical protein
MGSTRAGGMNHQLNVRKYTMPSKNIRGKQLLTVKQIVIASTITCLNEGEYKHEM